jgi:hypothetical protein
MKNFKRLSLVLILAAITGSIAFASFPYSKDAKTDKTEVVQAEQAKSIVLEETHIEKEAINSSYSSKSIDEDMIITLVLAVFLGWIAAHRWYKNKPLEWNILYLICVLGPIIFGSILGFPLLGLIGFIWWAVDIINIVTGEF